MTVENLSLSLLITLSRKRSITPDLLVNLPNVYSRLRAYLFFAGSGIFSTR